MMPIKIKKDGNEIAWLCDEDWELPAQIDALQKWLKRNEAILKKGMYTADLGFSPREGAAGGGCLISIDAMRIMVSIGMELWLSEYPPFEE
jgi:hypothetical protein